MTLSSFEAATSWCVLRNSEWVNLRCTASICSCHLAKLCCRSDASCLSCSKPSDRLKTLSSAVYWWLGWPAAQSCCSTAEISRTACKVMKQLSNEAVGMRTGMLHHIGIDRCFSAYSSLACLGLQASHHAAAITEVQTLLRTMPHT